MKFLTQQIAYFYQNITVKRNIRFPRPVLDAKDDLILIGTSEAEQAYIKHFALSPRAS